MCLIDNMGLVLGPNQVQGRARLEPFNLGLVIGMIANNFIFCSIFMVGHHCKELTFTK
jgi:hypothetical protein